MPREQWLYYPQSIDKLSNRFSYAHQAKCRWHSGRLSRLWLTPAIPEIAVILTCCNCKLYLVKRRFTGIMENRVGRIVEIGTYICLVRDVHVGRTPLLVSGYGGYAPDPIVHSGAKTFPIATRLRLPKTN
jgi:hypothetical protein